MKQECEVVKNVALNKEFWYCRTHKVEAHDCPKNFEDMVKLEETKNPGITLAEYEQFSFFLASH